MKLLVFLAFLYLLFDNSWYSLDMAFMLLRNGVLVFMLDFKVFCFVHYILISKIKVFTWQYKYRLHNIIYWYFKIYWRPTRYLNNYRFWIDFLNVQKHNFVDVFININMYVCNHNIHSLGTLLIESESLVFISALPNNDFLYIQHVC